MALIGPLRIVIAILTLIPVVYLYLDRYLTWMTEIKPIFDFNARDAYIFFLYIVPLAVGYLLTLWGHYFRADRVFQHSIAKVSLPSAEKQRLPFWDRRLWGLGVHVWIAIFILVTLNIVWFTVATAMNVQDAIELWNYETGVSRVIGNAAAYTFVLSSGLQFYFVIRRSALHALGFTYPEILPLHRALGTMIILWATVHVTTKLLGYHWAPGSHVSDAFDYSARGMQNTCGIIAYTSIFLLGIGATPYVRRRLFIAHIFMHRIFMTIFFICMTLHYPKPMVWCYILPSFILFLVDRFVPKMLQARVFHSEALCSFNPDCQIVRMVLTSSRPIKPYYPGDYITVQVPKVGTLYHPFTITSYWPEDPCSITLIFRVHHASRCSWTSKMAKISGQGNGNWLRVPANVDGVFGDRRHEYLRSDVIILFVAGTAITTFMGLIKSIAAQVATATNGVSPRLKMYLVCTFRTRSELHIYGSFLHQITRDPRFTAWLDVKIYVSRPDKRLSLTDSQHDARLTSMTEMRPRAFSNGTLVAWPDNDDAKEQLHVGQPTVATSHPQVPEGTESNTALHPQWNDQCSASVFTHNTVVDGPSIAGYPVGGGHESMGQPMTSSSNGLISVIPRSPDEKQGVHPFTNAPPATTTRPSTYENRPLPTYPAANSATLAKQFAMVDLTLATILIIVPLAVFYGMRAVSWEGSPSWCALDIGRSNSLIAQCMWRYSFLPGFIHLLTMVALGYIGLWLARRGQRARALTDREDEETTAAAGTGASAPTYPVSSTFSSSPFASLQQPEKKCHRVAIEEEGNWDDADVVYSQGRMDVKWHIDDFVAAGIGRKKVMASGDEHEPQGLVSVFGAGPDGFVDMVQKHTHKADWNVVFHRETWSP